jgi:signal transduction histidine kinase
VLDLDTLLPILTEETRAAFDLYHVSVFLRDEAGDILRLHAGTGEAGSEMVRQHKQFQFDDQGLVPLAARERQPQVVNDVHQSPNYSQNPLLPNTRSEVALPMMFGLALVGVLDLQSDEADKFSSDDLKVLTTLAEQIAVAVRNAYLFAQMQAAQHEAEKANSVKSQFLASMSHELRTPLNAILNFTQFVSSGMLGSVNDEQVDMLQKVTHSGKHLLGLINDVLDISKIEAGALKLFVESNVDMAREAQAVIAAGRSLLIERPVELQTEIMDGLPGITGDKRRIRQIMLNLISNACKFTEQGTIRVVLEQQGDAIVFAVHDSGPGIAPEDAALVFETFRQTTNGLRQGEGTGLGLPISRRLAEAHGGRLWFDGVPGAGAHFYVSLPLRSPELEAQVSPPKGQSHVA